MLAPGKFQLFTTCPWMYIKGVYRAGCHFRYCMFSVFNWIGRKEMQVEVRK